MDLNNRETLSITPVRTMLGEVETDPQMRHLNVYPTIEDGPLGAVKQIGMPIATGAQGIAGSLETLLQAGVEPDPGFPPPVLAGMHGKCIEQRRDYVFPVIFRAEGASRA
ncbi:MAG TPA: hypothetical protein VHZ03_04200 [Trebonia sp.]|nr:hypothetical protein [Trebonia sp.]